MKNINIFNLSNTNGIHETEDFIATFEPIDTDLNTFEAAQLSYATNAAFQKTLEHFTLNKKDKSFNPLFDSLEVSFNYTDGKKMTIKVKQK